ncbi:MAG: glnH [Hyphomicrobiales bacterium]|nr:glnH [Hyphomicrobiales bacterium]
MKSFAVVVKAAVLALAFVTASQAAGLPDLKGRTIVAVTENAYVPLNFADPKTGQGIGWEYDAVNEIAKRLNAKVDWKLSSWDVMIQSVRDGQYDIGMDGITINADRAKQIAFSAPYMTSEQYMLVRAKDTEVTGPESFKANPKLLIGAQAGTTNFYTAVYNVLDGDEKNPRIKLFDTFGASVQALKTGDVDTVLMDQASANGYIGANPDTFKVVGGPLGSDQFGFILKQGSDLIAPVNAALAAMKADGTIDALNKKWLYEYQSSQK